jgi:hypothetical protein
MANTTKRGSVGTTPFGDYVEKRGAESTAQTWFVNSMLGLTTAGYATKMDDAASKMFAGVMVAVQQETPAGASNGDTLLDTSEPRFITVAIAAATVADIGRVVYAVDDQTVAFTGGTYANPVGTVASVRSATAVVVECEYGGKKANKKLGASRTMAATGAQSLTKYDLNKTILLPNTAAYALTLPAVADTQAGDEIAFVKTTAAAFAVTLTGSGAELIDGSNTLATIDAIYDTAVLVSTGAAWVVKNRDIA